MSNDRSTYDVIVDAARDRAFVRGDAGDRPPDEKGTRRVMRLGPIGAARQRWPKMREG